MIKLMNLSTPDQSNALNKIEAGKNPNLDNFVEIEDESDIPYLEIDPPDAIPLENVTAADEDYQFQG